MRGFTYFRFVSSYCMYWTGVKHCITLPLIKLKLVMQIIRKTTLINKLDLLHKLNVLSFWPKYYVVR